MNCTCTIVQLLSMGESPIYIYICMCMYICIYVYRVIDIDVTAKLSKACCFCSYPVFSMLHDSGAHSSWAIEISDTNWNYSNYGNLEKLTSDIKHDKSFTPMQLPQRTIHLFNTKTITTYQPCQWFLWDCQAIEWDTCLLAMLLVWHASCCTRATVNSLGSCYPEQIKMIKSFISSVSDWILLNTSLHNFLPRECETCLYYTLQMSQVPIHQ